CARRFGYGNPFDYW
nr:immunoglobulin heavy chain junction region [Mus musculus]